MEKSKSNPITMPKSNIKRKTSSAAKENTPAKIYVTSILKGFAVGALTLFLILSLFSIIIMKSDYSVKSLPIMAIVSCIISTYIGGYWSSKHIRKNGLVVGIITSIPLVLLVLILSSAANCGSLSYVMAINVVLMVILGAIGGIMAVNKSPKRHK